MGNEAGLGYAPLDQMFDLEVSPASRPTRRGCLARVGEGALSWLRGWL